MYCKHPKLPEGKDKNRRGRKAFPINPPEHMGFPFSFLFLFLSFLLCLFSFPHENSQGRNNVGKGILYGDQCHAATGQS
jgi:hypothetical protein